MLKRKKATRGLIGALVVSMLLLAAVPGIAAHSMSASFRLDPNTLTCLDGGHRMVGTNLGKDVITLHIDWSSSSLPVDGGFCKFPVNPDGSCSYAVPSGTPTFVAKRFTGGHAVESFYFDSSCVYRGAGNPSDYYSYYVQMEDW